MNRPFPRERDVQFMLLIIADETRPFPTGEALAALQRDYGAFTQGLAETGRLRGGAPLMPSAHATTLREVSGRRRVSDGPAVGGDQHLAGFFLIECPDRDEAIAAAGRIPGLRRGEAVEIRPVAPTPDGTRRLT